MISNLMVKDSRFLVGSSYWRSPFASYALAIVPGYVLQTISWLVLTSLVELVKYHLQECIFVDTKSGTFNLVPDERFGPKGVIVSEANPYERMQ
ncbi:MAG: hypothetical protein M1368_01385, partial [Thaumarchaeota archaeon]|nr:hypothetical protein [Nitrososphaerota archaeon]